MTTPLKVNRPHNRLVGSNPKIGIRPTIDGRRLGVRESLEKNIMGLAKRTAHYARLIALAPAAAGELIEISTQFHTGMHFRQFSLCRYLYSGQCSATQN